MTRQIRFRPYQEKSFENKPKLRLKYNRSMFAGTKDQLTELCLKVLMEENEVKEKLIVESLEPIEGKAESTVTLSHKLKVRFKENRPEHGVEVRCLTSWVRWKQSEKEIPMNDIFREDEFVRRKLKAQLASRKRLCQITGYTGIWLTTGEVAMGEATAKNSLYELGTESEESPWKLIPKKHSYDAALPYYEMFRRKLLEENRIVLSPPGAIVKRIEMTIKAERPRVYVRLGNNNILLYEGEQS